MARPPTPVGTWGQIKVKEIRKNPSVFEAHARMRMEDGTSKQVRKRGKSKTAAENALKEKLRELADEVTSGQLGPDTRFGRICDDWHQALTREYKLSGRSPQTPRLYGSYIRNWIKPALGELHAREVLPGPCNNLLQRGRDKSYDTAKSLRAVLSAVCDYAVRQGAMKTNPVKSAERLATGDRKEVKAMTLEQRLNLIEQLEELGKKKEVDAKGRSLGARSRVWQDLPDIVRAMLATGPRLGELLAVSGDEVDPAARTVLFAHHLVREPGVGLRRMPNRKGNGEGILLAVPEWSLPMWRARKLQSGGGPLFPNWTGDWMDPNQVMKRIREAMDECGFEWVTSHVWRKTVATVLDEADLPTTAIADQLGNTPKVVETHYRRKRVANQTTATALEDMLTKREAN